MRAIVIEEFGDKEQLVEREVAKPKPSRNEVRIKIKAVGFNPVDCKRRAGLYQDKLPLILGSDCSGIIDAVGNPHCEFAIGDEVCGFSLGRGSNGTYAQYICLPIQFVTKKPSAMNFEEGASFPLVYLTAFQGLIATNALQKDSSLFIAGGGGGVGSAAIALAKCYGANPILTTAGNQETIHYLTHHFHLSKDQILPYKDLTVEQIAKKIIDANHKKYVQVAFDCVGGKMKELCFHVCDYNSHVITILPEQEDFPLPVWGRKALTFQKSLSLHCIFVSSAANDEDQTKWTRYKVQLKHLAHLFEKEKLLLPQIHNVGKFSAETVQSAHTLLEKGHSPGKLVMNVA